MFIIQIIRLILWVFSTYFDVLTTYVFSFPGLKTPITPFFRTLSLSLDRPLVHIPTSLFPNLLYLKLRASVKQHIIDSQSVPWTLSRFFPPREHSSMFLLSTLACISWPSFFIVFWVSWRGGGVPPQCSFFCTGRICSKSMVIQSYFPVLICTSILSALDITMKMTPTRYI